MPSVLTCPSCGKVSVEGARYCIGCGEILSPIYCSSCGTRNPDGLEQCLECGSSLPSLAGFRWVPVVTVLNPTSAMSEQRTPLSINTSTVEESPLKKLFGRHDRHSSNGSTETPENSQT